MTEPAGLSGPLRDGAGEVLVIRSSTAEPGAACDGSTLRLRLEAKLRELEGRRIVYRARTPEGREVALKFYLAHPRQRRDADREWNNLLELRTLGLPAPEPLLRGSTREGGEALVSCWLEDARSLRDEVFFRAAPEERRGWMALLLELLAQQHAAGARQEDSHWGNVAISRGKLYALDAAGFVFNGGSLSRRARLKNLAAWFVRMNPLWEDLLWEAFPAYLQAAGGSAGDGKAFCDALHRRMGVERRKLLREQRRKGERTCSAHRVWSEGGRRVRAVRDLPDAVLQALLRDPNRLLAESTREFKNRPGGSCTVAEVEIEGRCYVLKRYNREPLARRLLSFCVPGRAALTWNGSQALRVAHVATARPLALLEGGPERGDRRRYLLLEKLEGTRLDALLAGESPESARVGQALDAWERLWRALARIRAVHGDAKAANYVMTPGGNFVMLDLDSLRFPRFRRSFLRGRAVDRERFLRNWEGNPGLRNRFHEMMDRVDSEELGR